MAKRNKAGKYPHKITIVDDIKFHSELESKYYLLLKELKTKGVVSNFTLQPKFNLLPKFIVVDGVTIDEKDPDFNKIKKKTKSPTIKGIDYIADFDVEYSDGRRVIVDTKGKETTDFLIKKKLFKYKYPQYEFLIITLDEKTGAWLSLDEYKKLKKQRKKEKQNKKGDK